MHNILVDRMYIIGIKLKPPEIKHSKRPKTLPSRPAKLFQCVSHQIAPTKLNQFFHRPFAPKKLPRCVQNPQLAMLSSFSRMKLLFSLRPIFPVFRIRTFGRKGSSFTRPELSFIRRRTLSTLIAET